MLEEEELMLYSGKKDTEHTQISLFLCLTFYIFSLRLSSYCSSQGGEELMGKQLGSIELTQTKKR